VTEQAKKMKEDEATRTKFSGSFSHHRPRQGKKEKTFAVPLNRCIHYILQLQ
jgi:hypothetical protein